ncbi:unnamed protein product [Lathyrus sativus]|nr:unnamed protein product [Lathyrus sativus]
MLLTQKGRTETTFDEYSPSPSIGSVSLFSLKSVLVSTSGFEVVLKRKKMKVSEYVMWVRLLRKVRLSVGTNCGSCCI